jgi:uncharacterized protein YbjT (DUF2867 family)
MTEHNVIVTGATGMIGGIALSRALADPAVKSVTAVGRRPTGTRHPKLTEVEHLDFTDYGPIEARLAGHDVALFCLGTYTGSVSDADFRQITVDYTLAFARSLFAASPQAAFCLLSGQGADHTETSPIAFARYKGEAEKALLAIGFPRVHIFRPGYIYPVTPRTEPTLPYKILRTLYPVLRRVYPNVGATSEEVARVMVDVGLNGAPGHPSPILENRDIRVLAARA